MNIIKKTFNNDALPDYNIGTQSITISPENGGTVTTLVFDESGETRKDESDINDFEVFVRRNLLTVPVNMIEEERQVHLAAYHYIQQFKTYNLMDIKLN